MGYLKNVKSTFKWKYSITYIAVAVFLGAMLVLDALGYLGKGDRSMITRIGFSIILTVSLNLVVGFLGELSLGHAGFMCIGAYLGCFVANVLDGIIASRLVVFILSMLVGGLIAAVFGFIIGLPALRLKGDYLAIATLAFGEIVRNIFKNIPQFGGAKGLSTKLYDSETLYIITFIVLLIVLFLCQNFIRSKHGRAVTAIRDNEIAAKAMGINVTFYKLLVFILSAFFAGVAGVIYGETFGVVRQETFSYNYSIEILVMVVLGGMGSINGSIIAATIITYINIVLQNELSGALAPVKLIVYAVILILIVLYNNAAVFKPVKEKFNIRHLRERITHKKPEIVHDDEAVWTRIESKIKMDEVLSTDIKLREADFAADKAEKEEK